MHVCAHPTAADFLDRAGAFLSRSPVANQLLLAIARNAVERPTAYGGQFRGYSVAANASPDAAVLSAAVHTAPWPAQVAEGDADAAAALGAYFAQLPEPLPGIGGPDVSADAFAAAYASARDARIVPDHALGVFELRTIDTPPSWRPKGPREGPSAPSPIAPQRRAEGRRILADVAHAPLLQLWLQAFHDEATPSDPAPAADSGARMASNGRTWLWLAPDETPAAFVYNGRRFDGWASLGPVYTPPDLRGRGYATTLVTDTSAELLAQGFHCTLFTHLANPTSNAIYERIGYRRVGTARRLDFIHAPPEMQTES